MAVIVLLILVSVFVAGGFLLAFLWSVKTGQMDDDYTPSVRILFDDNRSLDKKEVVEILPASKYNQDRFKLKIDNIKY
jgi:cbb3-type cytochrome oxidase maturation protein